VLDVFKQMGIIPLPVQFPDSTIYPVNLITLILNAESGAAFDELTRTNRDDLVERQDKDFWPNTFRSSRMIPAVEYINAIRYRSELCEKMNEFMKNYDVVIVPTFAGSQLSITNLTGHPVVCLPMGFSKAGTPVSITFIGNLYDEATILEAAKAYQDKTEHNKKHPEKFLAHSNTQTMLEPLTDKKELVGVWRSENKEPITVEISENLIYYREHHESHKYKMKGDSIFIDYPDFVYTGKVYFENETLIMESEEGKSKYVRFKK
jgi:hypothetical protein